MSAALHARRPLWPPAFYPLACSVNVHDLSRQGFSCSAFHADELRGWISLSVDCNFVMWVLVITGVDFIRNFQRKKKKKAPEPASGRIKAVLRHYTGIKADPHSVKHSLSFPCLSPIFLTPTLPFFSPSTLIWWYHRPGLHNLPVGTFFSCAKKGSSLSPPPFALYREECCHRCLHKQTALTWHEAHMNEMRLITVLVFWGAKRDTEFGFPQLVE